MANKYLKTGGLNPEWCCQQAEARYARDVSSAIEGLLNVFSKMDLEFDFGGVKASVSVNNTRSNGNYREESPNNHLIEMCGIVW